MIRARDFFAAREKAERGNIFFFILIGVALFAALSYVISKGMSTQSVSGLSDRQASLAASDILDYAQQLSHGVDALRQKNVSESDICFYAPGWGVTTYNYCSSDTSSQVFSPSGGGVQFRKMETDWIDKDVAGSSPEYGLLLFSGNDSVVQIGTDGGGDSSQDLMVVFPYLKSVICNQIDKRLGLSYDPPPSDVSGGDIALTVKRFDGTFTSDSNSSVYGGGGPLEHVDSACVESGGKYYFYHVLIAR